MDENVGYAMSEPAPCPCLHVFNSLYSDFTIDSNQKGMKGYETQTGEVGISLPDAIAMSVAIGRDTQRGKGQKGWVEVRALGHIGPLLPPYARSDGGDRAQPLRFKPALPAAQAAPHPRSGYPLASCVPAELASVSPDELTIRNPSTTNNL